MINNHRRYCELRQWLAAEEARLTDERYELQSFGLPESEIEKRLIPLFNEWFEIAKAVHEYEDAILGHFEELSNFDDFGRFLVALRLAKGLSVQEFADLLDIPEQQVILDENSEYQGLTIARAREILNTLKVRVVTNVKYLD